MKQFKLWFVSLLLVAGIATGASYMDMVQFMPAAFKSGPKLTVVSVDSVVASAQYADTLVLAHALMPGKLLGVSFVPGRDIVGADTHYRKWIIGTATAAGVVTKLDSVAFESGVNVDKFESYAIYGDSITAVSDAATLAQYSNVILIAEDVGNGLGTPQTLFNVLTTHTAE